MFWQKTKKEEEEEEYKNNGGDPKWHRNSGTDATCTSCGITDWQKKSNIDFKHLVYDRSLFASQNTCF